LSASPAYALELNPVEGLWSSLKAVELANLTSPTLAEVSAQAYHGIERIRRTPHLAYSFLRPCRPVGLMTNQPDTQGPSIHNYCVLVECWLGLVSICRA
jgi:hypothetical protein